jgi:cytochrome b561
MTTYDRMSNDNRAQVAGYSAVAKLFHWVVALAIIGAWPVGFIIADRYERNIFDATTEFLSSSHKLFGFTILLLVIGRILYRVMNGAPAPAASLSKVQRAVSAATHHSLYALMFLVPLMGWLGVSAYPATRIFGTFDLPSFLSKNEALAATFFQAHKILAFLMAALIILHITAALMHAIIIRDGVFQRMWPAAKG